jgi:hypothetical protein
MELMESQQNEYILNKAYHEIFHNFTDIESISQLNDRSLNFFMLTHQEKKKYIKWYSDVNNLIKYTEFDTSFDFKQIGMNIKHETRQQMIVYSSHYREQNKTNAYMESVSVDIENDSC